MKQLINKYDSAVRLVGLEDVSIKASTGMTRNDASTMYFSFGMPTSVGVMECSWSAESWDVADYAPAEAQAPQSESAEFRAWLEKTIHDKNYTLSGVSRAMGFSGSWLWNVVRGKRRLPKKRCPELDQALALPNGTVARQLRKTGNKGSKNTTI